MGLEIRKIESTEVEQFIMAQRRAFSNPIGEDELKTHDPIQELERSLAAFEGSKIVGGCHSRSFEMNVPGGRIPVCGVVDVSVQPTHRRRGILTSMKSRLLENAHNRGETIAALYASESIIYGRFGYGIGSLHENWSVDRAYTDFVFDEAKTGSYQFLSPVEIVEICPEIYRKAMINRPGAIQPPLRRWEKITEDPESERGGASQSLVVGYKNDNQIEGYAHYRTKNGVLIVIELIAVSSNAEAALWRFCFGVDLMESIEALARPVDDPLPWMMSDPRRMNRVTRDGLWIRIIDVKQALSSRSYSFSDKLIIEVEDLFCSWNSAKYELEGGVEGASCRITNKRPEIKLSSSDLAAVYLGTVSFKTLVDSGRAVEFIDGSVAKADTMFRYEYKPWCPFSF